MTTFRFKPVVERTDAATWGSGVTRLVNDPGLLEDAREKWGDVFPTRYEPLVVWGETPKEGSPIRRVELLRVDATGRVEAHATLGHPAIPEDVFEAAVLLGLAMSYLESVQKAPIPDLYERPETHAWIDEVMRLCPQSEFLERFFSGFWRFARIQSILRTPARALARETAEGEPAEDEG